MKKNSAIKKNEFNTKLQRATELVEKYQRIAKTSLNKYIEVKANQIGVEPVEITNKLQESYSFKDIDNICEKLQGFKVDISKLPFNLD